MDNYDATMTMSYLAAVPMAMTNSGRQIESFDNSMLSVDVPDHHSTFDVDTFAGSEDATFGPHTLHSLGPPALHRFPSSFDDPLADASSAYDPLTGQDNASGTGDAPSIDRDHKLLSFSPAAASHALLDYAYRQVSVTLSAQLHGMFFLAESPWATAGDKAAPPTELTCYRRNLFQVTGNITLPRSLRYLITEQGEQLAIVGQELTVVATESVESSPVKLISVPWKTSVPVAAPTASTLTNEDKTEKEPPPIPLDPLANNGQEVESEYVSLPIAWKRLQFRIATANNGRRRELQQHFIVTLRLMATLANGAKVSIYEAHSGAIIVRGRSPRNFQSRRDFPLSGGSSGGARHKNTQHAAKAMSGDSAANQHQHAKSGSQNSAGTPKRRADRPMPQPLNLAPVNFPYDHVDMQITPDLFDWRLPPDQFYGGAMTAIPPDLHQNADFHFPTSDIGPHYAQTSPDLLRNQPSARPLSAPITLSLLDDEPEAQPQPAGKASRHLDPSSSSTAIDQPKATTTKRISTNATPSTKPTSANPPTTSRSSQQTSKLTRPPSFSLQALASSPDESADLLYEYFPLGLDDWMPPVDAVYRPHVVHHTNLPKDPKAKAARDRAKRYFSEDQP